MAIADAPPTGASGTIQTSDTELVIAHPAVTVVSAYVYGAPLLAGPPDFHGQLADADPIEFDSGISVLMAAASVDEPESSPISSGSPFGI